MAKGLLERLEKSLLKYPISDPIFSFFFFFNFCLILIYTEWGKIPLNPLLHVRGNDSKKEIPLSYQISDLIIPFRLSINTFKSIQCIAEDDIEMRSFCFHGNNY